MFGTYRDDDEWADDYGPGERCPVCGAPDWHPDPSGPYGQTWMICESCGLEMIPETGTAKKDCPHPHGPGADGFCRTCGLLNEHMPANTGAEAAASSGDSC